MKYGDRPIGVFDSGVGGLTVLNEISRLLPHESIVYLGDTARVPYGTKSPEAVTKFARQDSKFLIEKGVKLIVVACNTASAVSLTALKSELDVPVVGVIEPGAYAAVKHTTTGEVGVIGTEVTINSMAYQKAIYRLAPHINVRSMACPLFVPLAEEGWTANTVAQATADEYLSALKGKIDVLVLGCTHYPLLRETIQKTLGEGVDLVCSAEETAKSVEKILRENGWLSESGKREFYVSDNPKRFADVGKRFLGVNMIGDVQLVELDRY
jgi:glutamate racemase